MQNTPTTDLGRRAPEARRALIIEAADALFRDVGFEDTSISQVARRAGVAVGTVYLSYPDKASLRIGVINARKREIADLILDRAPGPGMSLDAALQRLVPPVFDLMLKRGPMGGPIDRARLEQLGPEAIEAFGAVDAAISQVFGELAARGVARPADHKTMPAIASGIMMAAAEAVRRKTVSRKAMKAELIETFNRLFAPD